jgi:predicted 3-demethylubiquinone-9 3-methyltransferase (glyoxalase superfamily)
VEEITPCLWFDNNAEEAMNFYVSLFPNSRILSMSRFGDAGPGPKGTMLVGTFELDGRPFMALNGGPSHKLTEAFSLMVNCETQAEVDDWWEKLSAGGSEHRCGWLKDKFGLSWQIVPSILGELMQDKDPEKSKRVLEAMLKMVKLDIGLLKQAYEGK